MHQSVSESLEKLLATTSPPWAHRHLPERELTKAGKAHDNGQKGLPEPPAPSPGPASLAV